MKLFHLSDLHIGLKLFNRDLSEDQTYILNQVIEIAARQQPEAILIAGDIYDKAVPSAEAVAIFDHFVSGLTRAVPQAELMIISGNHDSGSRVNVFRSILQAQKIHMIGLPPLLPEEQIEKVVLRDQYGPVNFYLLPFVKPSMVRAIVGTDENGNNLSYDATLHQLIGREKIDPHVRNVLVSHQFYLPGSADPDSVERMDSELCTVGNIDAVQADILEAFDYAALGHIHKPMTVGREVYRYCGTPLACSVSEAGQQKGIIMVTLAAKGVVKTEVLPLKPLRQVQVIRGTLQEVLKQGCDDYVSIQLTDQTDLDVFDMQDKLRYAFPNLLEIRRENLRQADYGMTYQPEQELNAFELCNAFLKDLDPEEQQLLRTVINQVQEAQS
ncbi:MAG: exonuclease SbcCD subunit D [Oscillospiraceae bacterium]|nr:exonuclease SbcCD subunit D [Oscillospiraceae bacterium]